MAILRYSIQLGDRLPAHSATILERGAIVDGAQNNVNTVNVHAGHDFEIGDKFLYALTRSNILIQRTFAVTAKSSTSVTFSGGTYRFPDGAFLINLGADTGGVQQPDGSFSDPEYDGSSIGVYSDPAGDDSYLYSSVLVEPGGDLGFWSNASDIWILARNSRGAPVRVYIDSQASAGSGGGGGGVDVDDDTATPGVDGSPGFLVVRATDAGDKLYMWLKDSENNYDWREILEIP